MARITAFYAFDMSNFNFREIYDNTVEVEAAPDANLDFGGRVIEDFITIQYLSEGYTIGLLIGGAGFVSDGTRFTGGTVTLLGESVVFGAGSEPLWVADRVAVPLPDLFGALMSPSTLDDQRLIERAFAGSDVFVLSHQGDVAFGYAGNDVLDGRGGDDALVGGLGQDTVLGGAGQDILALDAGNDVLDGGAGGDRIIVGGALSARVDLAVTGRQATGQGLDVIRGIEHADGGAGTDTLLGNGLTNILRGNGGNDLLAGRAGADRLDGGFGNDVLDGGTGNDTLLGGGNNDRLVGGTGADLLTGGLGADVFVFRGPGESYAAQSDVIVDFRSGTDMIDLSAIDADIRIAGNQRFDFDTPGALQAGEVTYRHVGGQTQVLMDMNGDGRADALIRLAGTLTLTADDFIL